MSHDRKSISTTSTAEGRACETAEEAAAATARLKAFANLVCMTLPATPEERAEMRRAVDVCATTPQDDYVFDESDTKNRALDEWKAMVEVCIGELVYPEKETLTCEDESALERFVEERLAVLSCGALFGGLCRARAGRSPSPAPHAEFVQ